MKNILKILMILLVVVFLPCAFEARSYIFPNDDGTLDQIFTTDGAGTISFVDIASLETFGEMYQTDNTSDTTVNTVNVWEEINNFSVGELQYVTFANSDLTIGALGEGQHTVSCSLSGVPLILPNQIFEFAFSVNNVIQTKTKMSRKFTSTTDVGTVTLRGILDLVENDVIKVELRNTSSDNNFEVHNANVSLH